MRSYVDTKKSKARYKTVVMPCWNRLQALSIPADRQYWTLCAENYDEDFNLLDSCELHQMLSLGLLKSADQFHGVDRNETIIAGNRRAVPEAHWHCEDLYQAMVNASVAGNFRPAVVNYDSLDMPESACAYLPRLMSLLSDHSSVVLVANIILKTRYHKSSIREIGDRLSKSRHFQQVFDNGWQFDEKAYQYSGTGKRGTWMGSLVFHRP